MKEETPFIHFPLFDMDREKSLINDPGYLNELSLYNSQIKNLDKKAKEYHYLAEISGLVQMRKYRAAGDRTISKAKDELIHVLFLKCKVLEKKVVDQC